MAAVIIWKGLSVKLAAVNPVPLPGIVTDEKTTNSPAVKLWEVLFTVTVAEPFVEVKVKPVIAVSSGLIS